jgi:hypothetical protein
MTSLAGEESAHRGMTVKSSLSISYLPSCVRVSSPWRTRWWVMTRWS